MNKTLKYRLTAIASITIVLGLALLGICTLRNQSPGRTGPVELSPLEFDPRDEASLDWRRTGTYSPVKRDSCASLDNLTDLKIFHGKNPYESGFFERPVVKRRLSGVLSNVSLEELQEDYTSESPILVDNNKLFLSLTTPADGQYHDTTTIWIDLFHNLFAAKHTSDSWSTVEYEYVSDQYEVETMGLPEWFFDRVPSLTEWVLGIMRRDLDLACQEDSDKAGNEWISSVKGHINPNALENNETREMWIPLWWDQRKGEGKVELVPALKKIEGNDYVYYQDIHNHEYWTGDYEVYGKYMWYLQISAAPYKVVDPLYLSYYLNPHIVYEGDLNQDGYPDFGILLNRKSLCCAYVLLTIRDGHWKLLTEPFPVAYNLRESGRELARKGNKKGEIRITRSGFDDDDSSCVNAQIVDTTVFAKYIDIGDSL